MIKIADLKFLNHFRLDASVQWHWQPSSIGVVGWYGWANSIHDIVSILCIYGYGNGWWWDSITIPSDDDSGGDDMVIIVYIVV